MNGAAPGPADASESVGVASAGGVTVAAAAADVCGGAAGVRSELVPGAGPAAGCSGGADSASSAGEPSSCTGDSARMPKSCGQGGRSRVAGVQAAFTFGFW